MDLLFLEVLTPKYFCSCFKLIVEQTMSHNIKQDKENPDISIPN